MLWNYLNNKRTDIIIRGDCQERIYWWMMHFTWTGWRLKYFHRQEMRFLKGMEKELDEIREKMRKQESEDG